MYARNQTEKVYKRALHSLGQHGAKKGFHDAEIDGADIR